MTAPCFLLSFDLTVSHIKEILHITIDALYERWNIFSNCSRTLCQKRRIDSIPYLVWYFRAIPVIKNIILLGQS